jgi:hypothetical protein
MISVDVWQGVDRLAFHENAILLDVKVRSQGDPSRSAIRNHGHVESQDGLTPQLICGVLDDFALVVSGNGGKDNVSAACMECDEELGTITLRISSNDGVEEPKLASLQGLLRLITKIPGLDTDLRCEDILNLILQQCATSFLKHVNKFLNELKQAGCPPDKDLRFPGFSIQSGNVELPTDTKSLGPYNRDSHRAYMQLHSERLRAVRRISRDLITSKTPPDVSKMGLLAKAAYDVRRSSSFDRFVRHNLLFSQKPVAVQLMAQSLKERLGKMSRVWRAAKTLAAFGLALVTHTVTVNILCLPASRQTVRELCERTPAQLRRRGGQHFGSGNDGQLQTKLGQWQSYRLHCEMQLVVFYQENPHLQMRSRYIGCNKLACYLCYDFITRHGQFQVKGCHQGLYSLWTVPPIIKFATHQQASRFSSALRQVANVLESKVDTIRKASQSQWKYRTNNESTANLSRISLQWLSIVGPTTNATPEIPSTNESRPLSQPENRIKTHDASEGSQDKVESPPSTHIVEDGLVTQSAENCVPSLVASTTQNGGWKLGATLPAPTECLNLSATAITLPGPTMWQIETGKDHASMISWPQDSTPTTTSQEIEQSGPTPHSNSTSRVSQLRASKEEHCSQYQAEQGEEEYVQNAHEFSFGGARMTDKPSEVAHLHRDRGRFDYPQISFMSRIAILHISLEIMKVEPPTCCPIMACAKNDQLANSTCHI